MKLYKLFIIVLTGLVFEYFFRSVFLDIAIYRDILLVGLLAYWIPYQIKSGQQVKMFFIDYCFGILVTIGFINVLVTGWGDPNQFNQTIWEFRTYFLPITIYFVGRSVFNRPINILKIYKWFEKIYLIFTVVIIFEAILSLFGKTHIIPWYQFTFLKSYRFLGNISSINDGYIDPSNSPILGLLGWPHSTVVIVAVSFFFVVGPKLMNNNRGLSYYLYIMLFIISLAILKVKMHILSAFIVFVFLMLLNRFSIKLKILTISFIFIPLFFSGIHNSIIGKVNLLLYGNSQMNAQIKNYVITNEFSNYINLNVFEIFFGVGSNYFSKFINEGSFEVRYIYFLYVLGLCWFIIFTTVNFAGLYQAKLIYSKAYKTVPNIIGVSAGLGLFTLCFEMGHYSFTMSTPHNYIWAVLMAIIVSAKNHHLSDFSNKTVIA